MINKFYIVFLLLFGLLFLPTDSYACGSKSEKSCCSKEVTAKSSKKACCSSDQESKDSNECDGTCGHSGCTTTTSSSQSNFILFSDTSSEHTIFDFSKEKSKSYYVETLMSFGFSFIWQPPKITLFH